MIVYFTSTSPEQAIEFARIALSSRLFVPSWNLNGVLHHIVNNNTFRESHVSLAYCNETEKYCNETEKYIGVVVRTRLTRFYNMQAFVRDNFRSQGIGKQLVTLQGGVGAGVLVGPGMVGSDEFWEKCRVPELETEEIAA